MIIKGEFPFLKEKNHVISLVGAEGKTTLMYALARRFAGNGARTLITTTTHIYRPEGDVWARSPDAIESLWRRGSYAVAGRLARDGQPEKLTALPEQELNMYIGMADIVLIEADGAKRMPCKVPAGHEPVIPEICDIVIGTMGMKALGKPLEAVCFRQEEAIRLLGAAPTDTMTVDMMVKILASEKGTRKNVGKRDYYVVLNQCDSEENIRAGDQIGEALEAQGITQWVMTRFNRQSEREG